MRGAFLGIDSRRDNAAKIVSKWLTPPLIAYAIALGHGMAVTSRTRSGCTAPLYLLFYGIAVGLLAVGCSGLGGPRAVPAAAEQTIYHCGVPHTDRMGAVRLAYEDGTSFFPIGLYHALEGRFGERDYDLPQLRDAGFNTILPWGGQPIDRVIAAAVASGLQVIWHEPTDEQLARFGNSPAILGWDIDHEPSLEEPDANAEARYERFLERRRQIHALSNRPVFTVNSPSISATRNAPWQRWADAGDIAAFWKYPFFDPPVRTLTGDRGVPEVTRLAVTATGERKPVLYVAQAFRGQSLGWFFPDAAQTRGMVYAAIVHGATGIIWFGLDSFVLRNDQVIGASPDPAGDYGIDLPDRRSKELPRQASADELADSRRMWGIVRELNRELAGLAPVILSPTADVPYTVHASGPSASTTPIRTLLKATANGYILIAVNVDAAPVLAHFSIGAPVRDLVRIGDATVAPAVSRDKWTDTFGPFAIRLYRWQRS